MAAFLVTDFFGVTLAAAGEGREAGRGLEAAFAAAFLATFLSGALEVDFFAISVPNLRGSYVPAKIQTADRFAI